MQECSIIIPTLNEEQNIAALIQRIESVTKRHEIKAEIIFVDDGSADATREIITAYHGEIQVRLIARENQRGLSGAVVTGARAASFRHIAVIDADLSHPPEAIPELLGPLQAGTADMVIGSRYVAGGSLPDWPWHRRLASLLASLPARLLTGMRDPLAGFIAVRKSWFESLSGELPGFKIGLELLVQNNRPERVQEVPIVFVDRQFGSSKMGMTVIMAYLRQLMRLCGFVVPAHLRHLFLALGAMAVILDQALMAIALQAGFSPAIAHTSSFLVALHCAYLLLQKGDTAGPSLAPAKEARARYLNALLLMLAMLFLRGGLIAPLLPTPPHHPSALLSVIQGLSVASTWLLIVLAWPEGSILRLSLYRHRSSIAIIVCYSILLRLAFLGSTELIQEEAYYWNYAQHLDYGYLDHPPVVALLIRLGTLFFGDNEFGIRIGALLCWSATAWFSWRYGSLLFGRRRAALIPLFIATMPIFFGTGLLMTPDAPLIACWAGALYFLHRALIRTEHRAWLGVGICIGIGLASKYTIALFGPATLVFMILDRRARKWFATPYPYLAALIALLLFSPVILWNYQHDWASFAFQSQRRLADKTVFSLPALIASILGLLTPVGLWAIVYGLFPSVFDKFGKAGHPNRQREYRFILAMTIVPLSVFVFFSLFKEVKVSWTGPLWLAALPLLSAQLARGVSLTTRQAMLLRRSWPATLATLVMAYGICLHYFALGLPGIPFPSESLLVGWPDLALRLEKKINTIERQTGSRPIVVGMDKYRVSSGLAFYRNKMSVGSAAVKQELFTETSGRHLFGDNDLMFRYWQTPEEYRNRDMIVVSTDSQDIDPYRLKPYATSIGDMQELTFEKSGKPIGPVYFRVLSGYRPTPKTLASK